MLHSSCYVMEPFTSCITCMEKTDLHTHPLIHQLSSLTCLYVIQITKTIWHVLSWCNLSYDAYSNYLSLFGKKQQTMRELHYIKLLPSEIASLTCCHWQEAICWCHEACRRWQASWHGSAPSPLLHFSQRPTVQSSSKCSHWSLCWH